MKYDDDKEKKEDDSEIETELMVKVKEEENESTEKELSILLEDEEIENEELDSIAKLIYDNSYLFHHKKKEIPIREEVLNILNKPPESQINVKDEKNNSVNKDEKNDNEEEYTSNISNNNLLNITMNKNKSNTSIKSIKYKIKKRKKAKFKNRELIKLSLFNNDLEIKEEKLKENEDLDDNEERLEQKLNEFFKKIQSLKNNTKDLADLDFFINDEFKDPDNLKFNSRRINDFIESITNNRDYDRLLKPRYNFLSPIKFSTKDLLDQSY